MLSPRSSVLLSGVVSALFLGLSVSFVQAATLPITITNTGFVPATLKIVAGDTLEFRNSTTATQSARTAVASGFNTGDIGPSQSKSVVVSTAGTYSYTSAYNAALTGSVEVASAAGTTSTASSALTSQPVTTQAQPVSGVFEVVVVMVMTGSAFVIGGVFWQRKLAFTSVDDAHEVTLTQVPRLTLRSSPDDDQLMP